MEPVNVTQRSTELLNELPAELPAKLPAELQTELLAAGLAPPPTSVFVEQHTQGLRFYLNGDLQFDTADEAIYHEHLVVPALALATQRFPNQPLRVLICGGGDGLAARDVRRFAAEVVLVDYDPSVVELGRTMFAPYNQDSLNSQVTVHIQDALEFVAGQPDRAFHVVLCDFTFPTTTEATRVYSREWFEQVRRVLVPGGLVCANAISPERQSAAFWCLYQTLRAAGLSTYPLTCEIPSFRQHNYGLWGFLLASSKEIARSELSTLQFPVGLQTSDWSPSLTFRLPASMTQWRERVYIHTLDHPQLLYYLLNEPGRSMDGPIGAETPDSSTEWVDFLDLPDQPAGLVSPCDPLQLESLVQAWLQDAQRTTSQPDQLCPVQHPGITPVMAQSWLDYVPAMLSQIDFIALSAQMQARGSQLTMASGLSQNRELSVVLAAVLVAANLAVPDAVFAKGYGGGSYSGSSFRSGGSFRSGSTTSSNQCNKKEYYPDGSYDCIKADAFPWMGLIFTLGGGAWLWALLRRPHEEVS